MAPEIERKFLVISDEYKRMAHTSVEIEQGYLCREPERTVRIRIKGSKGFITVKGLTRLAVREEYEYEIPLDDARRMLLLCQGPTLSKRRWLVDFEGHTWEVDEFFGRKAGLTVAEVELHSAEEPVSLPSFVGEEVTGRSEYYNSML